jgi:hypothetical protein
MAKKDVKSGSSNGNPLPLFYTSPAPLDAKQHAKLGLKKNFGFDFAKGANAVPVTLLEMPQVSHFYPIAFSPDDNATPVAIMGLRDNENLFLKDGRWIPDTYIPSYIRRYPFIFSEIPGGGDKLTLCIDMIKGKTVEEGGDQPFFNKEGKGTALAESALEFCKQYHQAAMQTMEFSKALAKSGLLVERSAQIPISGNRRINFSGFRSIDENKLIEMKDKDFLEWRKKGWLPFLYAHLFSGAQWQRLTALLNERLKKEAA